MTDIPLAAGARSLARAVDRMRFGPPVAHVYDPLRYARAPWEEYLARFGQGPKRLLFLGMNPGPWGMAQTGVPFGEVNAVRDWLGIGARVRAPASGTHPRVPVSGFDCPRREVSGRRLWGLMAERYGTPAAFARECFVSNWCPLLFLDEAGRNLTPDRIARADAEALAGPCDRWLALAVAALRPRWLVGVGAFAHGRLLALRDAGAAGEAAVLAIPHPSPANPAANRGWAAAVREILERSGAWGPRGPG